MGDAGPAVGDRERRIAPAARALAREALAGLVTSVPLIANIVSFGALMFPGDLAAGAPTAIWAMLIGSSIGGLWIARTTSIPPLASGIDSPTGAVLVLLSAAAAARVLGAGGTPEAAVQCVMLIFTIATLTSGLLQLGLGACRWGSYFRFVPYFVVGGFLGATGWLLVLGGLRMIAGGALDLERLATQWSLSETAKLAGAGATLAVLLGVRRWFTSAFAMPASLLLMWLTGAGFLRLLGLAGPEHRWYFPSLGSLETWSPLVAAGSTRVAWPIVLRLFPDILAVVIVAIISLVTKVSSLEVVRQTSGDLDREFRAHGEASLLAAPFGGILASLQVGSSRLLEHAGSATWVSGAACAVAIGAVGLAGVDLPSLIPIPIVAGLVCYLGYTFFTDAFRRPFAQRAWSDVLLATAIMIVCVRYGYLAGVLGGLVGACLLFATSYARIGVVRRAVTRGNFASYIHRSPQAAAHLARAGDAIRIYWLSGYIFFGSSESVLARIRRDIETHPPRTVAWVIVDFGLVSGVDSSAVLSLTKLRNYCDQQGVTLVCCSLSPATLDAVERGGVLGARSRHQVFADMDLALAWCEDQLLAGPERAHEESFAAFESWLQRQLGPAVRAAELLAYFERKTVEDAQVVYERGEAADTVDLVASGILTVEIEGGGGKSVRLLRIMTHTVIGEMGFFRRSTRSATVLADGPATVFTLTRESFERMRAERPDLAGAFYEFIIGALADRLEFSNRTVAALRP